MQTNRRVFLKILAVTPLATACGAPALDCSDAPGLTQAERDNRASAHYLDVGPDRMRSCARCTFFPAGAPETQCGLCSMNMGNVNPRGACDRFVARA